jgi:MFS family permease
MEPMTQPTIQTPSGSAAPLPARSDRFGIIIFCIMIFFYWSAMYVYVPTLPVYARSLGASLTIIGLLVGAYGFSQMVLRIPIGILSDRWGVRRPFISIGFVAAGVGALGLALAPTPELLVVSRAVVGIAAATWVTATVLFTGYFKPTETARAIGLLAFVGGIAQLVSTTAGGKLAEDFGWQAPFVVAVVLATIGLATTFLIRENRQQRTPPKMSRLIAAATIPSLLVVSLVAALVQYAFWATTYAFVPIFADDLGASRTDLGLLAGASLTLYTVSTLGAAPLVSRLGARTVVAGGLVLMAVSTIVVPFLSAVLPLAIAQAISGVGRGVSSTVLMSESIRWVPASERATAMGVFQAVYAIGMFVGPATAGLVADTLGLAGAFLATGVLTGLGAMVAMVAIGRDDAK